jgi:hypothetical protein
MKTSGFKKPTVFIFWSWGDKMKKGKKRKDWLIALILTAVV